MSDPTTLVAAVSRLVCLKGAQARAYADLVAARDLLLAAEQTYNESAYAHVAAERHVATLAGINTHGIKRKLELQHARYTKSDVRI